MYVIFSPQFYSLFAVENGAHETWACESNPFMTQTAKSVFTANNATAKVSLIEKHSTEIEIPLHIPQK